MCECRDQIQEQLDTHIAAMTTMVNQALVMGTREWDRAAKILATDGSLPKIRSTRQQRRRRMRRTGMPGTAILISERDTMSTSNKLQPLVRKGRGQLAKQ